MDRTLLAFFKKICFADKQKKEEEEKNQKENKQTKYLFLAVKSEKTNN